MFWKKEKIMPQSVIVTTSPREIRSLARAALKGAWVKILICVFIAQFFTSLLPSILSPYIPMLSWTFDLKELGLTAGADLGINSVLTYSALPLIFMILFNGPFRYAISRINLRLIRERAMDIPWIFSGFKKFGKTFLTQFLLGLMILIGVLPVFVLSVLVAAFLMNMGGVFQALGAAVSSFGSIIAMVIAIFLLFLFAMTYYILADNPDIKASEAIKSSVKIMRPNTSRLVVLRFSYFGWGMLAFVVSYAIMQGLLSVIPNGGWIVNIIGNIPLVLFTIYMDLGDSFFYEFAIGHLRRSGATQVRMVAPGGDVPRY